MPTISKKDGSVESVSWEELAKRVKANDEQQKYQDTARKAKWDIEFKQLMQDKKMSMFDIWAKANKFMGRNNPEKDKYWWEWLEKNGYHNEFLEVCIFIDRKNEKENRRKSDKEIVEQIYQNYTTDKAIIYIVKDDIVINVAPKFEWDDGRIQRNLRGFLARHGFNVHGLDIVSRLKDDTIKLPVKAFATSAWL